MTTNARANDAEPAGYQAVEFLDLPTLAEAADTGSTDPPSWPVAPDLADQVREILDRWAEQLVAHIASQSATPDPRLAPPLPSTDRNGG